MKPIHPAATVAVALLAASRVTLAAEPFARVNTTTTFAVLDTPQGIRNVGMGATGVSNITQPTSGWYNPATLAWTDAFFLSSNYQTWVQDATLSDTRVVAGHDWGDSTATDTWRLGGELGYTRIDFEFPERTIYLPEGTGRTLKTTDHALTSAIAVGWQRGGEAIAFGASAKYLNLEGYNEDLSGWAFDYGLVAAVSLDIDGSLLRPRVGFAMVNMDDGIEIDSLEFSMENRARVGLGLDFATPKQTFSGRDVSLASAAMDVDYTDRERFSSFWAMGWEVSILELVQARAGFRWYDENDYSSWRYLGFGVGWDFGGWVLRADYAHEAPANPYFGTMDLDRDMFGATVGARF